MALVSGAVLGGGASIIDQICSGQPINWGETLLSTGLGALGGGLGFAAGKALQWAAKTPAGQTAIGWIQQQANRIPGVRNLTKYFGARGADGSQRANLASPERTKHILDGDGPGKGGHRWPGQPKKTPFPRDWSDEKIMETISDIATDPRLKWVQRQGRPGATTYNNGAPMRYRVDGAREGISIRVGVEPGGEGIITGFPTQWQPLKATPAELVLRNEIALWSSSWANN